MNKLKVSVLIANYNNQLHINECINSIKKQTYQNIEIILVDNNSSDNTIEIVKSFNVKNNLSFYLSDMRNFKTKNIYGYIFNLFTSFGYFDNKNDNIKVLKSCHNHLKKNGLILIDFLNAEKITLSGNKWESKEYIRYTGYPGGQRSLTARELFAKDPTRLVEKSVKGMLPKNKLGAELFRNLKVYVGENHKQEGQSPVMINLNELK